MGNCLNDNGATLEDSLNEEVNKRKKEIYELIVYHDIIKLDKIFLIKADSIPNIIERKDFKGNELLYNYTECEKMAEEFFIFDKKFMETIREDNKDYIKKSVTLEIDKNENNYSIIFEGQKTLKFERKEDYKYKFISLASINNNDDNNIKKSLIIPVTTISENNLDNNNNKADNNH